jgi:hypothetical protein
VLEIDELQGKMMNLTKKLMEYIFRELAVMIDPLDERTPYLTGSPRGKPPT